jgi:hypothetical protein
MYQHHQLYTSCMCQLINYLSQPCTQHVPQPYTKYIHQYNHQNLSNNSSSIHKPNTINPYIKPCATTSLLCSLKLNQQLQQHITTKRPIPICQIPTTKYQLYPSTNLIYAAILNIQYHLKS